jgi:L-fuconolactonase
MNLTEQRSPDRRQFLAAGALALASSTLVSAAHTHFYDPTRPQGVPWPGKDDKRLYRRVLPAEFKDLTKKHNVRSTIVVEASPWLEDNQWLLDLARKEPFIVGVVGRLDPAQADFAKNLARFVRDPVFRGIRVNHAELRKGIEQKAFLDNLRLLVKHDRELDLNGGLDLPADVERLARAIPDLRIVINHAANLRIDGNAPPENWLKRMRAAAAGKNVYCKVSALVEGTGRKRGDVPANGEHYRPILDALWDLFGENRLIYGSNWPVSENAAPYATVFEIVHAYFRKRGAVAAEKFFERNAVAAYKPADRNRKPM